MVRIVAPTDAAVLIKGKQERQGTDCGNNSQVQQSIERPVCEGELRRNSCGLLESELFGHERGAFTGAVARGIGRFERAHRGTLFWTRLATFH
jgi:formate hydrogenlyase transcriptional activator